VLQRWVFHLPLDRSGSRFQPDIVEAILKGNEPSGLSLKMLTKVRSAIWAEQRSELGFDAPYKPCLRTLLGRRL
jgi:hypothetical protein